VAPRPLSLWLDERLELADQPFDLEESVALLATGRLRAPGVCHLRLQTGAGAHGRAVTLVNRLAASGPDDRAASTQRDGSGMVGPVRRQTSLDFVSRVACALRWIGLWCIYNVMELDTRLRTVARDCLARKTRSVARAITTVYQEALQPHGLMVSQFNILVAIAVHREATPGDLVDALHLEKSTVSRNVRRLEEQGWIRTEGEGRRVHYSVTRSGRSLLAAALPDWQKAQRRARDLMGPEGARALGTIWARIASTS